MILWDNFNLEVPDNIQTEHGEYPADHGQERNRRNGGIRILNIQEHDSVPDVGCYVTCKTIWHYFAPTISWSD